MAGGIIDYVQVLIPAESKEALSTDLEYLRKCEFAKIFNQPHTRLLLGLEENDLLKDITYDDLPSWAAFISHRLQILLREEDHASEQDRTVDRAHAFVVLGVAALDAFVQSNVTGPPLLQDVSKQIVPPSVQNDAQLSVELRQSVVEWLSLDGTAPYKLTPNIELFGLAKIILSSSATISRLQCSIWPRLRVDFMHQRMLAESSTTLESTIRSGLQAVNEQFAKPGIGLSSNTSHCFRLEQASIQLYDGSDIDARKTLQQVTTDRGFQFVLTGMLGVRTKFQSKETSQLVVLARSASRSTEGVSTAHLPATLQPRTIDLNDDTVLDNISFSKDAKVQPEIQSTEGIPPALEDGQAEKEALEPLDAIILLLTASSITNTSPADGLTREETMPYASRVIDGGSTNWQVYTQALLVRSRIEGYRSRTVERGLLQLQALVDQVIADTTGSSETAPTTFLPRPAAEESASPQERLQYVYQLASPLRWALEAELAARWVSLGGLKTALEIYERLEMWPEVALCWAGTERDDKARQIVRRQLFHSAAGEDSAADVDKETWHGTERDSLPSEAPRLFCILGDLDQDPAMYERAWDVSKQRYHRAQRSLGRYWYTRKDYAKAAVAYSKAVKVKQLDHATWFAMGCALLELEQFPRAVEVFSRAVQLENDDAESWSNLAVALLNAPADIVPATTALVDDELADDESVSAGDPQRNQKAALKALKQAARLKRDNHRIWDNILTVAATINPPPYHDIVTAQQRIIEIRAKVDGEKCVDVKLLTLLTQHLVAEPLASSEDRDPSKPGLAHMTCQLFDRSVVPLITSSAPLWHIVQSLATWRNRPSSALEAAEKAWRVVTVQPGWELGTEEQWNAVVNATTELVEAYKTLGPREITEGMARGSGALVAKDWQFKSRSAVRGIMGRGKSSWEDTKGWQMLVDVLETVK